GGRRVPGTERRITAPRQRRPPPSGTGPQAQRGAVPAAHRRARQRRASSARAAPAGERARAAVRLRAAARRARGSRAGVAGEGGGVPVNDSSIRLGGLRTAVRIVRRAYGSCARRRAGTALLASGALLALLGLGGCGDDDDGQARPTATV